MNAQQRRLTLWAVLGGCIVIALFVVFRPQAVPVDTRSASLGTLVVSVDEEGETRVRDIFVLSAPVAGRMLRIEAEAGDKVVANETIIAEIEPVDPTFLDFRSEAQAKAAVRAAESAKTLAQAEVDQWEAELDFARAELVRARELIEDNTISQRDLDDAERNERTAKATYATKIAALQVANFELERARAELLSPAEVRAQRDDCDCVPITAPVDGRILRVLNESEGVVAAGDALLEIGDATDLEIVVDLLSADAVKVAAGQKVIVEGWGGDRPLIGRVRRVEPFGFTKISALGIEEQRVNVIIDFTSPQEQWTRLGHGYQVDLRIVLWERSDVITLPLTALFRSGDQWAVFIESDGYAEYRDVTVGKRSGLEAEITGGLEVGEQVILYPSDAVADGVRVSKRG
ncbi:MAG: efflux RND transporter periplasmic adaptor subunit [Gammaproteobacteria bacterium]|jgi:HlyD family secretion protein|nr:efflux RND transporter periplasmic adaptor subunit [Gammaproteobacteria bacterium]